MARQTPGLQAQHAALAPLSSRYIDVPSLPWQPTRFPGVEIKVLMEDPETGLQTVLSRMAPGAVLTDHMHVEIEQTWVLEGSLVDHEGEAKAGTFVWRPAGSRHTASAPNGAVLLGFFLKPNTFF
ncbi:MAG: cupin domain-containing protein [Betaproteobacteria bacterium]|nr:cupin domain-containing protein [Betaproteobacteria bacterium]